MQDEIKSNLRDYERDLWEMEARQISFRRFQQVFQIYAVMGAVIGFGGLAYFFARQLDINLSSTDQKILMIAGSGFMTSIMSGLYLFLRHQRLSGEIDRSRYMSSAAEFLRQWARFENLGREKLEAKGRDFNRMSIRAITSELLNAKLISDDEIVQLEEVLRFRNLLVHGGTRADPDVIARMSEKLCRISQRVET